MNKVIKSELSEICQSIGARIPLWTQGAGGNISIKDGDTLWIKATGFRLDSVTPQQGMARVDFRKMSSVLDSEDWKEAQAEQNYANLIKDTTLIEPGLGRASMETGFHARLSKKYVLHFHSLASLLICHEFNQDKTRVLDWLKKTTSLDCVFIEACRPGWVLSKKVFGDSSIYFLESHGIILQSDQPSILEDWKSLEIKFCTDFGYEELNRLLREESTFQELIQRYGDTPLSFKCYFPDVAVFRDRLEKQLRKTEQGLFYFPWDSRSQDKDMAELWLATLMLYHFAPHFEEVPSEISSVVKDLPTEKLRQKKELYEG